MGYQVRIDDNANISYIFSDLNHSSKRLSGNILYVDEVLAISLPTDTTSASSIKAKPLQVNQYYTIMSWYNTISCNQTLLSFC